MENIGTIRVRDLAELKAPVEALGKVVRARKDIRSQQKRNYYTQHENGAKLNQMKIDSYFKTFPKSYQVVIENSNALNTNLTPKDSSKLSMSLKVLKNKVANRVTNSKLPHRSFGEHNEFVDTSILASLCKIDDVAASVSASSESFAPLKSVTYQPLLIIPQSKETLTELMEKDISKVIIESNNEWKKMTRYHINNTLHNDQHHPLKVKVEKDEIHRKKLPLSMVQPYTSNPFNKNANVFEKFDIEHSVITNFDVEKDNEKIITYGDDSIHIRNIPKSIPGTGIIDNLIKRKEQRPRKQCPAYKLVEGTKFAVDAFQYGAIEGVTVYFLTHFHMDHYVGLTKHFSKPIYTSPITARLLKSIIKINPYYIHELELNAPIVLDGVEITALDANHCPGAIMLVFRILKTGKCILHTGDFRASPDMESEPIFWNNDIDIMYLDTTYLNMKRVFCTQSETIEKAIKFIQEFRKQHIGKRILYVCGTYLIGKERFWSSLAAEFKFKVWTEESRYEALQAIGDKEYLRHLVTDRKLANLHLISNAKINEKNLTEYMREVKSEREYDILLAFRPSGLTKDMRQRKYGDNIHVLEVVYSEHSSYDELKRFVQYLKPKRVISTLPKSMAVPTEWYQYIRLHQTKRSYQPTMSSFFLKNSSYNKKSR